jgi:hypothetical protein
MNSGSDIYFQEDYQYLLGNLLKVRKASQNSLFVQPFPTIPLEVHPNVARQSLRGLPCHCSDAMRGTASHQYLRGQQHQHEPGLQGEKAPG